MLYLFSVSWGAVSGWWSFGCLVLALLYAFLLYQNPANISKNWRNALFAIRTCAVFILSFLLLAPLVKSVSKHLQKPLILVLQDNSSSIKQFPSKNFKVTSFIQQLHQLKNNLGDDYDVQEFNFSKNLNNGLSDSLNGKQTDISAAFQALNNRFGNQNIGAVILASDGLYNHGSSPLNIASTLKTNIYTVALGDTIPRKDILIDHVDYNKTVFLGNDFIADVFVEARQTKGKNLQLKVAEDGKQILSKQINVPGNDFKKAIPLKLNASKKGIRKYQISLVPVADEISTANNSETIYVEVVDNRKKILILYEAPHPDVAAIRQSLESNQNYEVKTSLWSDFDVSKLNDISLLILEQLPNNHINLQPLMQQAERLKLSVWFLLGAQSNLVQLASFQKVISISSSNQNMQEVFAAPDASFTSFILSDSARTKISNFPPLLAPFGNYSFGAATSVLFKQKIGSVSTSYPLLAFAEENGRRTAVLTGEGLWRWRLNEFQQFGNHRAVDELLSQSVQYLSIKNNQKRFNVSTSKSVFDEDENVMLRAELYNKAFELVNQPEVAITIKNKEGKTYSYQFSRNNQSYQLDAGSLPAGEYAYNAQTKLGNENFKAAGNFTIKALVAEAAQSAADHQLLYMLAKQNGGEMVFPEQLNQLPGLIRKNENIKTVAYEDNTYRELIDEKWIFILLLLLLSMEWFFRRRNGEI
ncbi:vWA domain-containing protein [Mucilaginibacter arboris]|uniref:VWA domain-containing protein n=1 Tax=Mucilaginibacter arboris TaxID=2682090 RepID=A0A7K1STF6_9SPHI|nr:hypothetical protein [Mucilaginibacter arboris]MVN20544.1 hypothetical protein [Mucilaginibacter arboris]